jgi:large subunit ribosomal protein L22
MDKEKTVSAISKYIRIAPKKLDKILKLIRGKSYKEALEILLILKQKPGITVFKTLYSAASNALENLTWKKENLIITEAFVTRGSILKRVRPRARGKAYRIEKLFSHITIRVKLDESSQNN